MAAWETVSSLTQGTSCRRRDFCHAASRPSNLTWNWIQLPMDGYVMMRRKMRDISKLWHFLWGKMMISHQVEGFSPIDVQRNPKNGAGLPRSMEYRRHSWHPLRYQGCHGCRMRTGNCSLEWNLPGCIPMLSSWFWAGWFGSSGGPGRPGRVVWNVRGPFNWDCHYGFPMGSPWASFVVGLVGWSSMTEDAVQRPPSTFDCSLAVWKFGAENQWEHKKWGSMGL